MTNCSKSLLLCPSIHYCSGSSLSRPLGLDTTWSSSGGPRDIITLACPGPTWASLITPITSHWAANCSSTSWTYPLYKDGRITSCITAYMQNNFWYQNVSVNIFRLTANVRIEQNQILNVFLSWPLQAPSSWVYWLSRSFLVCKSRSVCVS